MNDVLAGNFAACWTAFRTASDIRVINWNIERGLRLRQIIDFCASQHADLLILQEVDLNARRTHRLNIAEEIARRLKMNYVFAREFQELTQGSRTSPAYHGQATLSRYPITNPRVIRFRRQSDFWRPRWYLPRTSPFQERLGGRIALVTQVEFAGRHATVYNLHLESRGDNRLRLAQLDEVLRDAERYTARSPVLVSGDFNFDASGIFQDSARCRLGFRSALDIRPATTTPRGLFRPGHSIDWAFVSGPMASVRGQVHENVNASDHYPLSFTLKME